MKKILLIVISLAVIGLLAFTAFNTLTNNTTEPRADVKLKDSNGREVSLKGLPQADVKMKDVSGQEISLNEATKSNGLLVMFSCNTCPYVIKNEQRTIESANYVLDKNVGVVLVNSNEGQRNDEDSYEAMQEYAKEQGYKWSYVVDKNAALANALGANRTPECFLFDKEGNLVYHGAIDDAPSDPDEVKRKHLKEAVDEMLAGKKISVATSRSVGCSIKRN